MLDACLDVRRSCIDVNGELDHLRAVNRADARARHAGIALITAAGFGATFGECAAAHAAKQLPDATHLRISVALKTALHSPAAARSTLSVLSHGGFAVVDGRLAPSPLAASTWRLRGGGETLSFAAAPLAECAIAHATTGVPNVVAGIPMPRLAALGLRHADGVIRSVARLAQRRRAPRALANESMLEKSGGECSRIWAEAWNARGERVVSLLKTGEGYRMAAVAAVHAIEALLRSRPTGALTPARAFGAGFALTLPGTSIV
jgi:short subunit dehydrogenase-like uncharacterized protein